MRALRSKIIFGIFIIVSFFIFSNIADAEIFEVSTSAQLSTYLAEAESNDEDDLFKIKKGTYLGNFVYASFEEHSLSFEGGYQADFITRDVDPANTVLDGEGNGTVLVLSAPDVAADFTVDGLTLQNGNVNIEGGGLYAVTNGTVTLANNSINYNSAVVGGGIWFLSHSSGTVTLTNNTISNNSASTSGGGGYLYSLHGTVTLTNNTISNNSASASGGGGFFHAYHGTVTLNNNTISDNSANEGGGGYFSTNYGTVTLNNNTISDNSANEGGGGGLLYSWHGTVTMTNNTIYNNSASTSGGGVRIRLYHDGEDGAISNIYNNIIWNNGAGNEGGDLYIENDANTNYFPSEVNLFNNDFDHRKPEGIYIQIDFPIDSSNLDNIDPSFVDPVNDDYHLNEGSVLINAGNDDAPELPLTDKDGNPRKVGSAVDMGAYEFQDFVAPVAAFMASPLVGVAPLTVSFTDESTGSIDTYYWDFGDGNDSTLQNPTHTYNVSGTYSVGLTVTGDSVSDTETKTDYITVVSPDAPDLSCKAKEFHSYEFGQKIVVKLQVENSGNTKADPFDVAFYLSSNGITQDELLELDTVNGGLNSQQTKIVSLRYESGISLSGKFIIAVLDPDGRILELDELNNFFSIRIP